MVSAPSGSVKTATAPASSAVAMNWAPCTVDPGSAAKSRRERVLGPQRDSADPDVGNPGAAVERTVARNGATGPGYRSAAGALVTTGHLPSTPVEAARVNAARPPDRCFTHPTALRPDGQLRVRPP